MKDIDIQEYNSIMEEKIRKMERLDQKSVISKFNGIRVASEYEKEEYLEYLKKNNEGTNKGLNIFSIIFIGCIIASIVLDIEITFKIYLSVRFIFNRRH